MMNKKILLTTLILLLLNGLSYGQQNQYLKGSDSDPVAKSILENVITNLDKIQHYKMKFNVEVSQTGGEKDLINGDLWVSSEKYRFELGDQLIVHDGNYNWIYLKQRNELQILDGDEENSVLSPKYFLSFHESDDYAYSIVYEKNNGKGEKIVRIDFKPTTSFSEYKKMGIDININRNLPESMLVLLTDGTRLYLSDIHIVKMTEMELKEKVHFNTSKYPGVQIEDLRLD